MKQILLLMMAVVLVGCATGCIREVETNGGGTKTEPLSPEEKSEPPPEPQTNTPVQLITPKYPGGNLPAGPQHLWPAPVRPGEFEGEPTRKTDLTAPTWKGWLVRGRVPKLRSVPPGEQSLEDTKIRILLRELGLDPPEKKKGSLGF